MRSLNSYELFKNECSHGQDFWVIIIIVERIRAILVRNIVMYFYRQREFRADAGGALFVDK